MADRVPMLSPLGKGTARVPAKRVSEFKERGWREVVAPKPAPRRTRKATTGDDE